MVPQRTFQTRVLQRTISLKSNFKEPIKVSQRTFKTGALRHHFWFLKNLSNQGSIKNHFLKEFFKEPIKVSQRTFKTSALRHRFWFLKNLSN